MMKGPTRHLSWNELACWNRLGRRFQRSAPGELVGAYPREWREDRAYQLASLFEDIRQFLGNKPIAVTSAFRTLDYNSAVGGARASQHVQGRALDIVHSKLTPIEVHRALRELQHAGKLPLLGGLGDYPTFVHIDIRPKINGRLSVWSGTGNG